MIKDETEITHIVIFQKDYENNWVLDISIPFTFEETCPEFHFNNSNHSELFFFTKTKRFCYDYHDEVVIDHHAYTYLNPFDDVPKFGKFSSD